MLTCTSTTTTTLNASVQNHARVSNKTCLISLLDEFADQSMSPAFQIRLARRLTQKID